MGGDNVPLRNPLSYPPPNNIGSSFKFLVFPSEQDFFFSKGYSGEFLSEQLVDVFYDYF